MAARMVKIPFMSPEAPRLATARPTMSMTDDCAVPHRAEPSSNIVKKTRKDHLTEHYVNDKFDGHHRLERAHIPLLRRTYKSCPPEVQKHS